MTLTLVVFAAHACCALPRLLFQCLDICFFVGSVLILISAHQRKTGLNVLFFRLVGSVEINCLRLCAVQSIVRFSCIIKIAQKKIYYLELTSN